MTPDELLASAKAYLADIAKVSSSPRVDQWAADLATLLETELPTLSPTIIERRTPGDRRREDPPDGVRVNRRHGGHRGGRRQAALDFSPTDVVVTVKITSTAPVTMAPADTHQIDVEVSGYPGQTISAVDINTNAAGDIVQLGGQTVVYTSSDPGVATVSASGLLTAVAAGTTTITARCKGVYDTQTYTIQDPQSAAVSIIVFPDSADVTDGSTVAVQARVYDGAAGTGNEMVGQTVSWASDAEAVATVGSDDATGDPIHRNTITAVAGGAGGGTATITATSGALSDTCVVTVRGPSTLIPSPVSVTQNEGTTVAMTFTVVDSLGRQVSGKTVTVVSSDTGVLTVGSVSASGAVHSCTATLVNDGSATVTATVSGTSPSVQATIVCTVTATTPAAPVSLQASPGVISQTSGTSVTTHWTPLDSSGQSVDSQTVTVTSTDTGVANPAAVTVSGNVHSSIVSLPGTGTATVTGTITSVTPNITTQIPVTVVAPGSVQPFSSIDFDNYTNEADFKSTSHDYVANTRHGWDPSVSAGNEGNVHLDTSVLDPLGRATMRTDWPDMTGASNLCTGPSFYRQWRFSQDEVEIWMETYFLLGNPFDVTAGYTNSVGSTACGTALGGLKHIWCTVYNPNAPASPTGGNWSNIMHENYWTQHWGSWGMSSGDYFANQNPSGLAQTSGKKEACRQAGWVRLRYHIRCSQAGAVPASPTDTGSCQNTSTTSSFVLRNGGGTGAAVGRILTLVAQNGSVSSGVIKTVSGIGGATPTVTTQLQSTMPFAVNDTTTYYVSTTPVQGDGVSAMELTNVSTGQIFMFKKATNLVNSTLDVAQKIYNMGAGQKIRAVSFNRNTNQGPTHAQSMWYGGTDFYKQDPGWGF